MKAVAYPNNNAAGFTLLELAIVLVIIAVLIGMSASMSISVIAAARLTATQQKISTIEQALMQYRTANNRLPCPGDLTLAPGSADYGLEAGADASSAITIGTGVCTGTGMLPQANFTAAGATNTFATGAEGALPAVTLGLSPDLMLDGWGNKLRYTVDISMTANAAFANTPIGCNDGAITVNDSNGNARSSNSIYALISHGANGHGAYPKNGGTTLVNAGSINTNEQTNCHCNSSGAQAPASGAPVYAPTYVQMDPTLDPTNNSDNFDDIVSHKERWQMQTPWDAPGGCRYIYVADGGNQRVEKFSINGTYISQIGCASGTCSASSSNGQFSSPAGMAIDSSGNLWVADKSNNRVQKFSSSGTWLQSIGGPSPYTCETSPSGSVPACASGSGNGQFTQPIGVAIDASGNIWVTDDGNQRIQKFNSRGTYLMTFGSNGTGTGQFKDPRGISIDSSGNVWVTDWTNNNVQKFNSSGTYQSQLGCGGSGSCTGTTANGSFDEPVGMAFDASGNIWVTDEGNNRVQKFNSSGTWLQSIGGPSPYTCETSPAGSLPACASGTGNGQFNNPYGVSIDANGNIWTIEYTGDRVQEFNRSGTYLTQFGGFNAPAGIAVSSR